MKNPCLEAALRVLEDAGVRNAERAYGSKHVQLRWTINGHPSRMYSMPATPSDVRAVANTRAGIRRLLRLDGAIAAPAPRKAVRAPEPAQRRAFESEPAAWHKLADAIEHHGIAAVCADIERIANTVETTIAGIVDTPAPAVVDPPLGDNPISAILRISNELRDAQASMRRAVLDRSRNGGAPPAQEAVSMADNTIP